MRAIELGLSGSTSRQASWELIADVIRRWEAGQPPDTLAALAQRPDLAARGPAPVVELAYEEYCLRCTAGEVLDPDAYVARFPTCAEELRRLINTHLLAEHHTAQPEVGSNFRGYDLLRELGRGAFARVFLAREPDV